MGHPIVITSGKGGVGKSTTTANLGTALAMLGRRVLLVDADIGLRNLDLILGLENRIVYDLVDVAEGRVRPEQAYVRDKRMEDRLFLLPASQTKDKTAVSPEAMARLVAETGASFDFVLIDSPAGIEHGFHTAVAGAQEAIVVTTPEVSAIRDADRVIGLLEKKGIFRPRLVINRIRPHLAQKMEQVGVEEIVQILGVDLLGIVPDDEQVIRDTNQGVPTVLERRFPAAQAYRNIARRILGESVPLMRLEETPSVFTRVRRFFSRR